MNFFATEPPLTGRDFVKSVCSNLLLLDFAQDLLQLQLLVCQSEGVYQGSHHISTQNSTSSVKLAVEKPN